jgi:tetratricopeptide (TPR) repeat protein
VKAFIVRPFGTKGGINFDDVQKYLIAPALAALDVQGSTTEPFLQAGNIRADMFQHLLVADLVIADISVHNANVFYELGIRHALQPKRTFLLRAKGKHGPQDSAPEDQVPFDLRTDRHLEYDSEKPGERLELLTDALRQTLASENRDSPVFQMLPDLEGQDRSRFLPVPQTFRDDVELAFKSREIGLLGLLAMEARNFFWASEGLRLVGRAQFNLKIHREAKATWKELYKLNPSEAEANQRLGTIYQRLGDLDASDQALQRVLGNNGLGRPERAEALSLIARNNKDRWRASWKSLTGKDAGSAAGRHNVLPITQIHIRSIQCVHYQIPTKYSSVVFGLRRKLSDHSAGLQFRFDRDYKAERKPANILLRHCPTISIILPTGQKLGFGPTRSDR